MHSWEKTKNLYRHMNDRLQRAYLTSNLSDLESVARLAKLVVEAAWVQPEPVICFKKHCRDFYKNKIRGFDPDHPCVTWA